MNVYKRKKKIPCDFFPYSGHSTAIIGIMYAIEEYLRRENKNPEKDRLNEDREKIKGYLEKYPSICIVKVRKRAIPEESKKCTLRGNYFESYLNAEIAPRGIYEGRLVHFLYIKPRFPK